METKLINGHNQFVFSDEEIEDIQDLFVNKGYSMRKIQQKYNCTQKPIIRVLDNLGIDHSRGNISSYKYNYPEGIYDSEYEKQIMDQIKDIPSKQQKYNVNDHYFDDIRNPEVVYTIGFLYADGCNLKDHIALGLEEQDYKILETINTNIQNEKPVIFKDMSNKHDFGYDYENQYQIEIYNKRIVSVLNILGVVPRKSLILEFPKWLHPSLYPDFIRGVFDGDGSVYRYYIDGVPRNTAITITSTENFCKALTDIAAKYIGINSHIYDASCHNGITRVFQLCGYNLCKKFLDWIYQNSTIHLERKYKRYCDYYNINNTDIA